MENKKLLEKLNRLGHPLFEATDDFDVNETLAEVVKSDQLRFWESFPVLWANAAKEELFDNLDYQKVEVFLTSKKDKENLKELLLFSLGLYRLNNLRFKNGFNGLRKLSDNEKEKVKYFKNCLLKNVKFKVAGHSFDPERVKKVFQRYFTLEAQELKSMNTKHDELSLEFSLSQLFSPKQKELFKKKLKGESLTKTEREYFSRVVKKKLSALANTELHGLAQRLLSSH